MLYNVVVVTSASGTVQVQADSPEEAARLVGEGGGDIVFPSLCHQCAGFHREYSLELGDEWDAPVDDDGPAAYEAGH